jgi:hypothetical protein
MINIYNTKFKVHILNYLKIQIKVKNIIFWVETLDLEVSTRLWDSQLPDEKGLRSKHQSLFL